MSRAAETALSIFGNALSTSSTSSKDASSELRKKIVQMSVDSPPKVCGIDTNARPAAMNNGM